MKLRVLAVYRLPGRRRCLRAPVTNRRAIAQEATADTVARDLQRKYDRVTDFSADFVHSYRGGVLKQQATERGTLLVKKPGKMRWEYTSPEKKLFVSDGHKIYSYIPQDRQVIVGTMPRDEQAPTPALFLTGKGDITRDFTAAFDKVAEAQPGSVALKLTPKRREPEYESLTLVVDPKTLNLQMLITVDCAGRPIGVHFLESQGKRRGGR